MLRAYINYPNPHVTIHGRASCASVQQQRKKGQRVVRLDVDTLSSELKRFHGKAYRFAAQAELNDMWLEVDFGDIAFERAAIEHVRKVLGAHYRPLASARVDQHC